MIELDGSDGGGQLLRSALALSVVTGRPFRMEDVRGSRPTPGLRHQHLAAVELLADVADADVEGATVGTETVEFSPGSVQTGTYDVDIGTAGSVTLVLDAVLPLALAIDDPIEVTVRGGTDVKWAPTSAYYERVKLPLLRGNGIAAAVDVDRPGFYPDGGGVATIRLYPSSPAPFELRERGDVRGVRIFSSASADLADAEVAERQADAAVAGLADDGIACLDRTVTYAETDGPGTAIVVRADYESTIAGFDALGERGKPAEDVADEAVERAIDFHGGRGAVDRHMADQLLVPLALVGGRIAIPEVTDHVRTNRRLASAFGFDVEVDRDDGGPVLVADRPGRID